LRSDGVLLPIFEEAGIAERFEVRNWPHVYQWQRYVEGLRSKVSAP